MSVEYVAKVKYGWLVHAADMPNYDIPSDYLECLSGWGNCEDFVFGIDIAWTTYIHPISEEELMPEGYYEDDEDWIQCYEEFRRDYPAFRDVGPSFYVVLICH